jgi:hypothetical protein
VDVVGSTAYKGRSADGVQPWLPFFVEFYQDFPVYFNRACSSLPTPVEVPERWKSLGDELIFVAELESHQEARACVEAFKKSIEDYRAIIQEKGLPLALKASAWTAGFPVGNAEIRNKRDGKISGEIAADYIGPSIDIGFRLGKLATIRRFVVSIELVVLLTRDTGTSLSFMFEETQPLKGVLDDRPYPIVWIDMFTGQADDIELQADKLIGRRQKHCELEALQKYSRRYIKEHGKPLMMPFIEGDPSFKEKPDGYAKDLETLREIARRQDKGVEGEEPKSDQSDSDSAAKLEELKRSLSPMAKASAKPKTRTVSKATRSKQSKHRSKK